MSVERKPAENLRERNIAERRQRILDSARRVIAAEGSSALSMRRLADESGLAVKTLYNLWGGRDAILRALSAQIVDAVDDALASAPSLEDPIERCAAGICAAVDHMQQEQAVFRSVVQSAYQNAGTDPTLHSETMARATQMQIRGIEAAIRQGLLRDVLDAGHLGRQVYLSYRSAQAEWAFGVIDADGFRNRALYGLYVTLLGVATDVTRADLLAKLLKVEEKLRAQNPKPPNHDRRLP